MIESQYSQYPGLVFRETFNSEQSVRKNGGTPTDVTFSNGVGSFNGTSSRITYKINLLGTYSIRFRLKDANTSALQRLIDGRAGSGFGLLTLNMGVLSGLNGTYYVNGAATTSITGGTDEVVVSGTTTFISSIIFLGSDYFAGGNLDADVELFEIYEGTLTASEVKNLYENKWNKEQKFGGEPKVDLLAGWDFTDGWIAAGAVIDNANTFTENTGTGGGIRKESFLTANKKYLIKISGTTSCATGISFRDYPNYVGDQTITSSSGSFSVTLERVQTQTGIFIRSNSLGTTTITEFTIQELNPETLIDFDSSQGVLKLGDLGSTSTITDVTATKQGAFFNGSTSLIDTGADVIGTKAVTVMGWIKPYSYGGGSNGRIIDNGKFSLIFRNLNSQLIFFSDLATTTVSANNSISLNKWQFVCVTRTSTGVTNFYIGDLSTAPALSGIANQDSGTPTAGTTNAIIGNNSGVSRSFDGTINKLKVVEGILSLQEITREWSESRKHITG